MSKVSEDKMPISGAIYALTAAILFGVTTPLAKTLLQNMTPILLAGLFYLGSGLGLALYLHGARKLGIAAGSSALQPADWLWLGAAIACGGIAAPILLMIGLTNTPAISASLFLNFEGVFTALMAWFVFHENFDARIVMGMILIVLGGLFLSVDLSTGIVLTPGVLPIGVACLAWAADNNLTRKISGGDPVTIACLKGLAAGITNLAIALSLGAKIPSLSSLAQVLTIGFLGYGVSLVLFVLALRHIGTARTGAYFSAAPFAGALVAITFLKEPISLQFVAAVTLMACGLWFHLTEKHCHEHEHEMNEHEHAHAHDEHHQHQHDPDVISSNSHSHKHKHERLLHTHPHFPDLHHSHH